ncbi:MAG: hypothetical protein WCK89_23495 [bacterium]
MTAQDIIVNAYTQAGLIETGDPTSAIHTMGMGGLALTGDVPTVVIDIALAALNRWYRYAWQRYPHRDIRIANETVAVAAGAAAVELPTALDALRSVRVAGGALLPLSEVREADFAAVYADAPGTPVAYVLLADGLTVDEVPLPVRRIRLAPVPVAPLTIHVNGLRRFAPLALADAPLLPKFEDALFFYVLAELHGYAKDAVQQKAALALADKHFENALACETGGDACDDVCVPVQSFANG